MYKHLIIFFYVLLPLVDGSRQRWMHIIDSSRYYLLLRHVGYAISTFVICIVWLLAVRAYKALHRSPIQQSLYPSIYLQSTGMRGSSGYFIFLLQHLHRKRVERALITCKNLRARKLYLIVHWKSTTWLQSISITLYFHMYMRRPQPPLHL